MKIQSIPIINFKSTDRIINRSFDKPQTYQNDKLFCHKNDIVYSNFTCFFRNDLCQSCRSAYYKPDGTWKGFRKEIIDFFKDAPKVNVYNFGCSDGSETYSFAMSLMDEDCKNANKFFPILAFDIDEKIINTAKSGKIGCDDWDIESIEKNVSPKIPPLYTIEEKRIQENYSKTFVASEELREKIVFEQGNIEDKIDEIKPSNSLVMCRNFWPYLDEKRAKEILRKLCSRLDKSSLIVMGNYDRYISRMVLSREGFKEIYPNVFKKEKPSCDFWIY